jgi:hypothetical protein
MKHVAVTMNATLYCGSNILAVLAAPHGNSGRLLVLWWTVVRTEV